MSARVTIIDLQVRKRLLMMQSDLHRTLLRAERANLRAQWNGIREVSHKVRGLNSWLGLGAAAVGVLAAWRGRKLARWVPIALAAWSWIQKLGKHNAGGGNVPATR